MTDDLLDAVRDLPKVMPYLHVPLQSGSDAVLARMKRGYTVADYRDMMARIHEKIPGCAVSSDFIVGFCGETDADFRQTVDLVKECRFKNSFIFKYSVRPTTKAAELLPDDVPEEVKKARNNELLEVQDAISEELNDEFLGRTVEVLIEGPSKKALEAGAEGPILQLTGRTPCDRIVVFEGNLRQVGEVLPVAIVDTAPHVLFGAVETKEHGPELVTLGLSRS